MATYEQIEKANKTIKTVDVKGKDYVEVAQRIKAFRMVYPNGTIETDMISNDNGVCIIKASIKDEEEKLLGTGYAYEKEGSTFINKTSYIENCETSAVGRALGMCGFGIDASVSSAEEVKNAILNQDALGSKELVKPMSEEQSKVILGLDEKLKNFAIKKYNLAKIEDLNNKQAEYIINSLKAKGVL